VRILIFGGSFDPPHKGHAALLKAAARQLKPDRILVIPAYQAPLKGRPGASAKERLKMLELGLLPLLPRKFRKKTFLDLSELRSRRQVYTVDTLSRFGTRHPGAEFHFVTGADSAAGFPRWKNPSELRKLARWWTAARPGGGKPPAFFGRIKGGMPDISSTDIRARLMRGESVRGLVAKAVARRIEDKNLYWSGLVGELERRLKPARFEHTLRVAELAEALARAHGQDAEKARLAGLLHDLGRSVPAPEMPRFARRHGVRIPALAQIARHNPLLAHAHLSGHLAAKLGCEDPEVLSAVRKHTLGDARMSPLDRLLFVADACSADRDYPGVNKLRKLAFKNLDAAFAAVVKNKLGHVREQKLWMHPNARSLWNSLRKRRA
jgi:nicotinate-nucleotide adenylyltransferase